MKEYYDVQITFLSGKTVLFESEMEPKVVNGMLVIEEMEDNIEMFNICQIEKIYYFKVVEEESNES